MTPGLTIVFFEDHFVCTILPNESAWEVLRVDGVEQIPLYFYVSNGDVRGDAFARERWEAGDPCAFGDFYRIVADRAKTFRRFELDLPVVQLLDDVVGRIRTAYVDRMLAFNDALDAAESVPLRLCFIPDIPDAARTAIEQQLGTRGFRVVGDIDYLDALVQGMQLKGLIPAKLNMALVDAAFGDMRFDYVEFDNGITKRNRDRVPTRGVDQRIGILARLLVEKAGRQCRAALMNDPALLDEEIRRFHRTASHLIDKFEYDQIETRVELSDFNAARVRVTRSELESRAAESFHFIKHRFEKFIGEHSNLARTDKILLNGKAIVSEELIRLFQQQFGAGKVIKPLPNVAELVSRGVFALSAPVNESTLEIRITVTAGSHTVTAEASTHVPIPPPPAPRARSIPPPRPTVPSSVREQPKSENRRSVAVPPLPGRPTAPPRTPAKASVDLKSAPPPAPLPPPKPAKVTPPLPPLPTAKRRK